VLLAAFNERGLRTNWFVVAMGLLFFNQSAKKQRAIDARAQRLNQS
jgi:hypothetical protein